MHPRLDLEEPALRALLQAAREFSKYRPKKNVSSAEARAFRNLIEAARVFAAKSDEQWAQEVIEARGPWPVIKVTQ
jgi:hypothetical protein